MNPYEDLAGALVAVVGMLFNRARERRPELTMVGGPLVATFDGAARTVVLGLVQPSGEVMVIERIDADVEHLDRFGAVNLPLPAGMERTH